MTSVDTKGETIRQTGKMRSLREETREYFCSYKAVCLLCLSNIYLYIYIKNYIFI